ncbi:MAG: PKD domain-containing protein, partial [Ginsengibacter sp.]
GGGAGGSVLLSVNQYTNNINITANGGKGADAWILPGSVFTTGPGGGGGGGIIWFKQPTAPGSTLNSILGGANGVARQYSNDPWGAAPGQNGITLFNLQIPADTVLFKKIDSVRIKDSATSCNTFNFKGLVYSDTTAVSTWQWYFGDGATANTQNISHFYVTPGTYTVKLVVTSTNGCQDSVSKDVTITPVEDFDFTYKQNICDPLSIQFFNVGANSSNPYWSFGDASTSTGDLNPVHTYSSFGNYMVKYIVQNGGCTDTINKIISVNVVYGNLITTADTTICFGSTKQINTVPASLSFCWSPSTYLDDPNSPNPITAALQNITYYLNAEVTGANVIVNGDFNAGNTGFTSEYNYANPNGTEGEYFVGINPNAWNGGLSNCSDHTNGSGNMMLINGAPTPDINVWKETVAVTPNTNYAFSTWIQALFPPNPAELQFSINGSSLGNLITASLPVCTWTQFYTTWNSGSLTSATISIVNKNTEIQGNDFALDDISFAPVFIKRDSIIITVEKPVVKTNDDTTVCPGSLLQLNTIGASSYIWAPGTDLSNPGIANPIATINNPSTYIVTGTSANGCTAKDTLVISTLSQPVINISNDTSVCGNTGIQLFATGGSAFVWSPVTSLDNPNISNPVATPVSTTTYHVTVTNASGCSNTDSIKVSVNGLPAIAKSNDTSICVSTSLQLSASGGVAYSWLPTSTLDNPNISNPIATPVTTTAYYVTVTNASGCTNTDSIKVSVNGLPVITKSNDTAICINSSIQLSASGGVTYLWTPALTLDNPNIANPVATPTDTTAYYIKVTNAAGCSNTDSVRLYTKSLPVISITNDTSVCDNTPVQLFASGGTAYLWTPFSNLNNPATNNPIATPSSTTSYQVKVTNAAGCSNTDSLKIITAPLPVILKSNDTSICANTSIQLSASGGSTYLWAPSSMLNNPNVNNPVATPVSTTTYVITVSSNIGCSQKDSIKISLYPKATILISNDTLVCNNTNTQLFASGGASYTWSPAATLNNPNIPAPLASPSATTTYFVNITDANSCRYTDSVTVNVKPAPVFFISNDSSICSKTSAQLSASGGDTYLWQPAAFLSDQNISNPVA